MTDFDPAEWVAMHRALPEELRERKAKIMVAAYAEVGVETSTRSLGGVWLGRWAVSDPIAHRAHEIGCRAIGIVPLTFEEWTIMDAYLNQYRVRS